LNAKRPTQKDVARMAGVSRGTVSMVLNNRMNGRVPISDETRTRVFQAAAALGYAPNPVGQMLAQGNNCLIGIFTYDPVFPYEQDDFYFPYLTGIQQEASEQAYNVLLFTRNHGTEPHRIYANSMNSLLLADGCILMGGMPDRDELQRLYNEGYPFVYIGRREVPGCQIDWVIHDYRYGAAAATRHLLQLGHRHLGFVGGNGEEPQADKLAGCRQALADGEMPETSLQLFPIDKSSVAAQVVQVILASGVTALLCDDRKVFEWLGREMRVQGVRVPGDLSLVSLTTAEARLPDMLAPTHVQLNQRLVGAVATRTLIKRVLGEADGPQQLYLPCKFVVGETTGPPNR
jgi:DNA-binding LacI/PurR family transcriptional regulator